MPLNAIARMKRDHPRYQAWVWLVASIIFGLSSFQVWSIHWTRHRVIYSLSAIGALIVIPGCPPLRINIREALRNDVYAIIKSIVSVVFFNLFKYIGELLKIWDDWSLCVVALCLYMYFLAVDSQIGIEDDLGFCDGLLFASYGTLISQIAQCFSLHQVAEFPEIPKWLVHFTISFLILFKNLKAPAAAAVEAPNQAATGNEIPNQAAATGNEIPNQAAATGNEIPNQAAAGETTNQAAADAVAPPPMASTLVFEAPEDEVVVVQVARQEDAIWAYCVTIVLFFGIISIK